MTIPLWFTNQPYIYLEKAINYDILATRLHKLQVELQYKVLEYVCPCMAMLLYGDPPQPWNVLKWKTQGSFVAHMYRNFRQIMYV